MDIFSSLFMQALDHQDIESFKTDPYNPSSCDECLLTFSKVLKCGKCKEVSYCGKECQVKAWRTGHKVSCGKITIRAVPGKGLGIVALRDLVKGELVAREMPMLNFSTSRELRNCLSTLSDSEKRKIMSLHDCSNKDDDKKLIGILFTNCLAGAGENSNLLYNLMSRFNHSCVPNIRLHATSTDPSVKPTPAIALKDIKEGEELCWSFMIVSAMYQDRTERRARLNSDYGILCCQCKTCSLTGSAQLESDENRLKLKNLEDQLKTTFNPLAVPELVRQKHDLFKKEGLDTDNNLMALAKDMMLASRSNYDRSKYKSEGLSYAKSLHDDEMINYFKSA